MLLDAKKKKELQHGSREIYSRLSIQKSGLMKSIIQTGPKLDKVEAIWKVLRENRLSSAE